MSKPDALTTLVARWCAMQCASLALDQAQREYDEAIKNCAEVPDGAYLVHLAGAYAVKLGRYDATDDEPPIATIERLQHFEPSTPDEQARGPR